MYYTVMKRLLLFAALLPLAAFGQNNPLLGGTDKWSSVLTNLPARTLGPTTMGGRITKLSHHQGFAASTGGSIVVFTASLLGIPVSTTHTITGSIIGAGVARRASAVRWGVASNVVAAWFITIPASAVVAAAFYALTRLF